jgi:hypothetical protein
MENCCECNSAHIICYASRSGRAVFDRLNAGTVGSNPTQGMDVCVRLFGVCVVLCVGSGISTGSSPVQGVPPTVCRIK